MDGKKPELDFTSSEFNALEALTNPDVTVPVPEAPMYDNLGQFISTLSRARAKQAQNDVRIHSFYRQLKWSWNNKPVPYIWMTN